VTVIGNLRSLGLTLKEIQALAAVYLEQPSEPVGPHLAALLERAVRRIQSRLEELPSRTASPPSEPKTPPCSPAQIKTGSSATTHAARRGDLDLHPGVRP
jgi:DNA-binding transcriptional MerR regulator